MKRLIFALFTTNAFTLIVLKVTSPNSDCLPHVRERKLCSTEALGTEATKITKVLGTGVPKLPTLTESPEMAMVNLTEEVVMDYTNTSLPVIYVVTPTYARDTQKADLTSMCHTLMHVPRLVWVVVEDSPRKTPLVTRLLARCRLPSVHLNTITVPMNITYITNTSTTTTTKATTTTTTPPTTTKTTTSTTTTTKFTNTPTITKTTSTTTTTKATNTPTIAGSTNAMKHNLSVTVEVVHHRGVAQRNLGLAWIRRHCSSLPCRGVVYFGDDDNKYDLRLFVEMRKTIGVSVFTVAFAGGLLLEGPYCSSNGSITKWHVVWVPTRKIPIDMAGFAINVELLMKNQNVWMGKMVGGEVVRDGFLEAEFLAQYVSRKELECRGYEKEILVWHTKTTKPNTANEAIEPSDPNFEI